MQNKKTILHFVESLPPVEAGEELKTLKAFPYHLENLRRMTQNDQENEITFVFWEDFGKPFCQPVKNLDLSNEARSQGWLQ
jgi:hypothetical protein